jgi:hypothetical protein
VSTRQDFDFMPGDYQAFGQRSRVILHPADAVARDGDDTNPHGPKMLMRRTPTRPQCAPRAGQPREAVPPRWPTTEGSVKSSRLESALIRHAVTVTSVSDVVSPPSTCDLVERLTTQAEAAQLTACDDELVSIRSCRS